MNFCCRSDVDSCSTICTENLLSWCVTLLDLGANIVSVYNRQINIDAGPVDLHSISLWKNKMKKISTRCSTDVVRTLKT